MATKQSTPKLNKKAITAIVAVILVILSALGVGFAQPLAEFLGIELPGADQPVSDSTLLVHFIDVGQADCILVQCDGQNLLIDAGDTGSYDEIAAYLDKLEVKTLDYVVATHPHADHIGSMYKVIDNYEVKCFYQPPIPEALIPTTRTFERMLDSLEAEGCEIKDAVPLDTFQLGEAKFTFTGPVGEYDDLNLISATGRLTFGDVSFMFTGDSEGQSEADTLTLDTPLKSTVLKMGHHGSSTSTSKAFWDAVSPEYCVIMVGEGNKYGHPHQETLDLLKEHSITPFRTDLNGDILFTVQNGEITVTTGR